MTPEERKNVTHQESTFAKSMAHTGDGILSIRVLKFSLKYKNSKIPPHKYKIFAGSLEAAYSLNWGAREI